jgi:hypothetical protein
MAPFLCADLRPNAGTHHATINAVWFSTLSADMLSVMQVFPWGKGKKMKGCFYEDY